MPPRFAYWTIILDDAPTSFRTKDREEILPLFNQLKAKNPSALLKWFSGGKLWDSPEQAREERERDKVRAFRETRAREQREQPARPWSPGSSDPGSPKAQREDVDDPLAEFRRQHGRPADGSDDPSRTAGPSVPQRDDARPRMERPWSPGASAPGAPRRGKDWRPGGEHRDPRDKYKLPPGESRKRWKERNLGPRGPKPPGPFRNGGRGFSLDGPAKPAGDRPWSDRPRGPKPFGSKPTGDRPWSGKPRGPKPFGSKPTGDRPWSGKPRGPKPPSSFRSGGRGFSLDGPPKPAGDRPRSDRPRGPKPFGSKPTGDRPWSGKPRGPKPPGPFRNGGRGFSLDGPPKPGGNPSTRGKHDRSLRADRPFGGRPPGGRPFGVKPKGPGGPGRKR